MEDFRYIPLDSEATSFRLVKLLRGVTIEIQCEIFHASISGDDTTCYEALSYTWGSTELVEVIELNSKRLRIAENLHSALQCLRYNDRDRIIWIDGICIDQENLEERSQQVRRMGNIFRSARNVIFWLGKPTVEIELLLSHLEDLDDQRSMLSTLNNKTSNKTQLMQLWSDIHKQKESRPRDLEQKMRKGLSQLLRRPWFERIWILQEVTNAQSAMLCCGKFAVSADVFSLGPLLLATKIDQHSRSVVDIMPGPERINSWWNNEQQRKLIYLHKKFSESKATDQRDTIFALLGMSSEPQDHELLRIDYTKPVQEVVMNAVRYWLEVESLPISEILDATNCFWAIRATFLCFVDAESNPYEVVPIHLVNPVLENVECMRDPSTLRIEPYQDSNTNGADSCYKELDRPEVWRDGSDSQYNTKYADAFRIVPWRVGHDTVRMLIIANIQEALIRIALNEWRQTFGLVSPHIFWNDKQTCLNRTLIQVAKLGSVEAAQIVLDHGAEINFDDSPSTDANALTASSHKGNLNVVKMLLNHGANVTQTRYGHSGSALIAASDQGHLEVVDTLLQNGAGAIIDFHDGYLDGSALVAAAYRNHPEVVQLLLRSGADINWWPGEDSSESRRRSYFSPLMAAASGHSKDIMNMLLDYGADVNAASDEHGTALEVASRWNNTKAVLKLLEKGADVDARTKSTDGSAVAAARAERQYESLEILAKHGATLDSETLEKM